MTGDAVARECDGTAVPKEMTTLADRALIAAPLSVAIFSALRDEKGNGYGSRCANCHFK